VIADLIEAHVINSESDLVKFNLTNGTLAVNGKLQPEELHEKLKLKYLGMPNYAKDDYRADPGYGLHYIANSWRGVGIAGPYF